MHDLIQTRIRESIAVKQELLNNRTLLGRVADLAREVVACIERGGKLVLCGNGGSASDALHFAGEIVGRFEQERSPWPAIALNSDVATMTAIANDYGYDDMFARQTTAHTNRDDLFIGISTSGNSENVRRAVLAAQAKGAKTAALLGKDGGVIAGMVDYPIVVPCQTTARVQESHITLIHILCELAEKGIKQERSKGEQG